MFNLRLATTLSSLALAALFGAGAAVMHQARRDHGELPVRWRRDAGQPIRVWVQPGSAADGWTRAHAGRVWNAIAAWRAAGVALRIERAASSRESDVVIEWVPRLPGRAVGKTWRRDDDGDITAGRITLAYTDRRGRPLAVSVQRGVLLHEIGHLLGLPHSGSRESVMYRELWSTRLAGGDGVALQALYRDEPIVAATTAHDSLGADGDASLPGAEDALATPTRGRSLAAAAYPPAPHKP